MNLQDLENEVLLKSEIDWVQACEVAEIVKYSGGVINLGMIQEISLRIIDSLLSRGLMTIGDVTERGFSTWPLSTGEALKRAEREWTRVKDPNIGDVCWLCLTAKGRIYLESA